MNNGLIQSTEVQGVRPALFYASKSGNTVAVQFPSPSRITSSVCVTFIKKYYLI